MPKEIDFRGDWKLEIKLMSPLRMRPEDFVESTERAGAPDVVELLKKSSARSKGFCDKRALRGHSA